MSVVVGLSPQQVVKKFTIGDVVTLQVLIDEKIGAPGDSWTFVGSGKWIPAGSFSVDATSVKSLPADGQLTKLEFRAVVHSKGNAEISGLTIKHGNTEREFPLSGQVLQEVSLYKEGAAQVPWILPTLPVGGWNYFAIGVVALILIVAIFALIRLLLRRAGINPLARKLDPRETALQALETLQSYARRKEKLNLDEWKKFSFELASVLRRYSDANFGIESLDLTDREFLDELRSHPKGKTYAESVAGILGLIDEVRYGTKELEPPLVPSLISSAKKYVSSSFIPAAPSPEAGR